MITSLMYRREIDGLRAVAVIPVILFHAGFGVFSGGYVGVDVFFVISGYLITTILINELEQGYLSIAGFYERRARRILPALFVVMLACLPFAYMWMLPSQLKDFTQSLVAVVTFSSNILFWKEEGYFAAAAELKPLLHTWSLAVEEQYYLLFPVFLLLSWRFGRKRVFWTVVAVAAVSLLMAEWGWRNKPSPNFYLAPTRAWELLAGSICAFLTVGGAQRSSNGLSAIGLVMIAFSIFAYDANTPFPSVYALLPVVGTALIILFAAQGTWVARLLSMRAFVGVGLISYSAYLWHQPLFAFARLRSLTEPSEYLMAGLAVAALLLAWATWHFVEQPFRKSKNSLIGTRIGVFVTSGVVGSLFVAVGLAGHMKNGNPLNKFDDRTIDLIQRMESLNETWVNKSRLRMAAFPENGRNNILLIGDSHSGDLLNALILAYGDKFNFSSVTIFAGCGNLHLDRSLFEAEPDVRDTSWCERRIDTYKNAEELIKQSDFVFLSSSWRDFEVKFFEESWSRIQKEFGNKFFVFGSKNSSFKIKDLYDMEFSSINNYEFQMTSTDRNGIIESVAGGRYLDPSEMFCEAGSCKLMRNGMPLFYDGSHATTYGVKLMAEWLTAWGQISK